MKKVIIFLFVGVLSIGATFAQRSVFVDTDYILNKIPAYKEAQDQLDKVLLSNDMRQKREQEILEKEKEVKELQVRRFGPEGDRFKKEEELMRPIQDEVFNAIKAIAEAQNYGFVFDASSNALSL